MIVTGISPPKKLTRPGVAIPGAGKVSDLGERLNASLRRRHATRKSIPQSARLSFVGHLASELEEWLVFALAGQHARKQLDSLKSIISAMRLLKRQQLRRRRERSVLQ
jgi:hypothetical protein